jgi:vitamin B12 transporter
MDSRMRLLSRLVLLAGTSVLAPAAAAQEPIQLDEIVVFGGILPSAPDRTGATVDVLGGGAIEAAGPSAAQALTTVPGVTVAAAGGLGATTGLRLRGLASQYIGVTIDGIEVADPSSTQTAFGFGTLMTPGIDRISVLKGTQSAVYGSQAIAGVIDIRTWRPDQPGFTGRGTVEAGSYETLGASASLGYLDDRAELALTLSRLRSDGFSARDTDTEADGFDQTSLNLSGAFRVGEGLRLGFAGLLADSRSEYDRSTVDPSGVFDERRTGLRAFAEYTTGAVTHEVALSGFRTDRFDAGGFTERFVGDRSKVEYLGTAELGPAVRLGFGADWTEERARLDNDRASARMAGVFGEVQYAATDRLDLALSLRHEDHSAFGGQSSGRIAAAWRAFDGLILRASAGSGYRAPSLYELYGPYGNVALAPETSLSLDLGVERRFGPDSFLRATAFRIEVDDLILFDFDSFGYAQLPGTTVSQGVELSAGHALTDRIDLTGSYTYTHADTDGVRLVRVPRHDLVVGIDARLGERVSGGLQIQHVRDTLDGFGTLTSLDDYTLINLTASYRVTDAAEAYLRVENVTDQDYQTVLGYNTPGRSIHAGLRTRF